MLRSCLRTVIALAMTAMLHPAFAVQLVVNGGFETGNLNGWTATSLGAAGCNTDWNVGNAGTATACLDPGNPVAGTFAAYNSFDGPGPLTYRLRQQITVPASVDAATLRWSQAVNWSFAGQSRVFSVNILDTSFALLGTVQSFTFAPPNGNTGWTNQTSDVTAILRPLAGQNVVLEFAALVPETFTGPAGLGLDAVSLDVTLAFAAIPTLSESALAALAALLALAAFVTLRRRSSPH